MDCLKNRPPAVQQRQAVLCDVWRCGAKPKPDGFTQKKSDGFTTEPFHSRVETPIHEFQSYRTQISHSSQTT